MIPTKSFIPIVILLFSFLGLAGCISPTSSPLSPTLTLIPIPLPTTSQIVVTVTPSLETSIPEALIAPTLPVSLEGDGIVSETIPICSGEGMPSLIPAGFALPGTLVYQQSDRKNFYLVGGVHLTNSPLLLPDTRINLFIGFSSTGEWLAFVPLIQNKVMGLIK